MTGRKNTRPLIVDIDCRSRGNRQHIHGPLQPMDDGKPSRAVRFAVIIGLAAALWLLIAAATLIEGHL